MFLCLLLLTCPSQGLLKRASSRHTGPLPLYSLTSHELLLSAATQMATEMESLSLDERFVPTADPGITSVSGGILLGFFLVQSRITKANRLMEVISTKKGEMQKLKANMLSDSDASSIIENRDSLKREIDGLENEFLRCITFLDIPNGPTLRFRIVQPDSQLTEQQQQERGREIIEEAARKLGEDAALGGGKDLTEEDNDVGDEEKRGELTVPSIEKSTPLQRALLFIGLVLISSLSSLLVTLMSDSTTSTRESYIGPADMDTDARVISTTTPRGGAVGSSSFKVREGVLEGMLREARER